jgi:hypothetical protein
MYINKIDELIDSILDDFYNKIIIKKDVSKFFEEPNFVKYQPDINKIFVEYIKNIDTKEIDLILKDKDNTIKVIEIIKKYIAYYIFMTFGFFYSSKVETYINNIVEFTKNQPSFNFKIDNFFNSESNGTIVRFYVLIKNILNILEADSVRLSQLIKKPEYVETITFLNGLGQEFIEVNFKLKNLNGNAKEQSHNIIKTIILTEIYFKIDKKEIHQFLDKSEKDIGEFIYIDIVVPQTQFIDYNTIEMSLSKRDVENGLAAEVYDLITKADEIDRSKIKTNDDKILELLNSKLVIPITEDFLLYHKDTEKYEKPISTTNIQIKKKDETKIKYIINKIDSVTEYHSKNTNEKEDVKKNIEKLFYQPLAERKAVLVNNLEDLKIITKLQNQGRRAIENNEYYNDLLTYRQYPYINFKDFQKYGFNIVSSETLDAIRSVNFDKVNNNNKNKPVQFRVAGQGHVINVIGFIIPSKNLDVKCMKLKDFIDIRKVGYKKDGKLVKSENGFDSSMKFIKRNVLDNKKSERPHIVWLFDLEKDKLKLDKYETGSKGNESEHLKILLSTFHDNIISMLNTEILNYIEKKKGILLQHFEKIIDKISKNIIEIPRDGKMYNELQKIVYYEKAFKTEDKYDKKEDDFPGLIGDIIQLPSVPKKEPEKIIYIKLEKFSNKISINDHESMEAEQYGAICQHNMTWDNITALRKKNPNKSNELLFEFFQQYIVKNHEDDFICKSCGSQINLKNYVLDGTYDDDGRFVSFNMPMDVPIEDIPEYEKYKSAIRNIEKDIDRIASISNINTLSGTSTIIKSRVKKIVKDTIDLLTIHNVNLKNIYKERSEKISAYGLNKELSNLFIFELDNSIFVYSSKDKDFYKPIKRNNIYVYLLFLIIIELSDSQLFYMTGDKICNYYLFSKYGMNWFNGIHIRKNNQNTIAPILNYKVLCYVIFYMSCLLTKYNLWKYGPDEQQEKKKKFDPVVQKSIIHTLIDFINSVLEMYSRKKHHYIYDIVANRFFQKLNTTFKNEEILNRIKAIEDKKIVSDDKKVKMVSTKFKPIILQNEYSPCDYSGKSEWLPCKLAKNFIAKRKDTMKHYSTITNITNCEKGSFHKWELKGTELICSICNVNILKTTDTKELAENIVNNYDLLKVQKLSKKYCKSGELHNYIIDTEKKTNICKKCNKSDTDQLTKKELDELIENINKIKQKKQHENDKIKENIDDEKDKDYINELKSQYGKSKQHKEDYFHFIDTFISNIESTLGKDVNLHNNNIFLRYDSYIINHDHNGYFIDKPYTITNDGNTMILKKNHPFFKKDVIYYTNSKLQIDIFYDAATKLLLGYKEKNKEFELSKRHNIYLRTSKSILNRIKSFGYPSSFINITEKMEFNKKIFKDPNVSLNYTIMDIIRNRIQILKKIITDLQRYIYRIAYNYDSEQIIEDNDQDKFLEKYKNKLTNIKLKSDKGDKFLKNWNDVKYKLFLEDLSNKTINIDPETKYVSTDEINQYDYIGNVILFYIVSELDKLLNINTDKFIKGTLTYLVLDIIVKLYNDHDEEKNLTEPEIKRFKYVLDIVDDREIEDISGMTDGFYDEYKDPDEEPNEDAKELAEDEREEMEAIDIENEDDMGYDNVDYASGVNFDGYYNPNLA